MIGTSFSVTEATRWTPPRKTKAAATATTMPMVQGGMPKALPQVWPMELDWTMQPMKPRARVMAMAKKPARKEPNLFWKARLM